MLQQSDIDLDLTAVFSLKKCPTCSPYLSQLNTFGNINTIEDLKQFQYDRFKIRLKFIKLVWLKFRLLINNALKTTKFSLKDIEKYKFIIFIKLNFSSVNLFSLGFFVGDTNFVPTKVIIVSSFSLKILEILLNCTNKFLTRVEQGK